MKKLTKSLLNYYAAFNETRFRFTTKINYAWSDDYQTLDFSLFPDFAKQLIESVANQTQVEFNIRMGDYAISLDQEIFKENIKEKIDADYTSEYLKRCIDQAKEKLSEKTVVSGNEIIKIDITKADSIQKYTDDGVRTYASAIRKLTRDILIDLQVKKRDEILDGMEGTSTDFSFNPNLVEQQIYDLVLKIYEKTSNLEEVTEKFLKQLNSLNFNLKLVDLFLLIDSFRRSRGSGGLYLFFHELHLKEQKYPLYYTEIDIAQKDSETYTIKSIRNLLNLNVSAINACKFDKILATVPKACPITNSTQYLRDLERYILSTYSTHQEFLLSSRFDSLVNDDLPKISSRIGLQVITAEDKKLLDYSELIGFIDEGKGKKIEDMIDVFINRNVESTTNEVDRDYKDRYPKGTVEGIIGSLPLPLSSTQKKVVTALENKKNKIIAVDGPPGTGKSYLISAIAYLANQLDKSVLITSHKKEALDVVEKILKERFQKLHPDAKPNVIRLSKEDTGLNSIANSLSSAPIAQAEKRYERVDEQSKYIEEDLIKIKDSLKEKYIDYKQNSDDYEKFIKSLFELSKIEEDLSESGVSVDLEYVENIRIPGSDDLANLGGAINSLQLTKLSFDSLRKLISLEYKFEEVTQKLDQVYLSEPQTQIYIEDNDVFKEFANLLSEISNSVEPNTMLSEILVKGKIFDKSQNPLISAISTYADLKLIEDHLENLEKISLIKRPFTKTDDELINKVSLISSSVGDFVRKDEKNTIINIHEITKKISEIKEEYRFVSNNFAFSVLKGQTFDDLRKSVSQMFTLKFERLLGALSELINKNKQDLTIADLNDAIEKYKQASFNQENLKTIKEFQKDAEISEFGVREVYELISWTKKHNVSKDTLDYLNSFKSLFSKSGLDYSNVKSFSILENPSGILLKAFNYIKLFGQVKTHEMSITPSWKKYSQYFDTVQKNFDKIGDQKLKNLKEYATEINRIKDKFSAKFRLDKEETKTLLKSFSCVISPTDLVSAYFPMEEDIIDILVIDEASQVSIAESLSLILRAKQVIVLGDELQYGAVGAVNVSKEYSQQYFSEIINSLSEEANILISEEEKKKIIEQVSRDISEDEEVEVGFDPSKYQSASTRHFIVTNLGIRSSTMSFAKAMANYQANLDNHFRCFPELISYSNEIFYRPKQMALIPSRIRTKPISEVIKFVKVETKGNSGNNVNLDEIYEIKKDIETRIQNGFKGSLGIITSFKEQAIRAKEVMQKEMLNFHNLEKDQKLSVWFVGDVQGEERDLIYYSLVEDKKLDNGRLVSIYPAAGGFSDKPENLKKQRLNVGFSRAKDTIVIVHSMPLEEYSDTSLGEALKHYQNQLLSAKDEDLDIEEKFGSPAEKDLYNLLRATPFYTENQSKLRLIAQFEIGKYLESEYKKYIPKYRTDFLMTLSENGKEKALIIEYDGVEYHTKNPDIVLNSDSFSKQYLEYDLERQLELESYGYGFLRINKYSLIPKEKGQTKISILDNLLRTKLITD